MRNRPKYTPETFKLLFKVGDLVSGWSTGKTVKITAIGETRFLARDIHRKNETVCTMTHSQGWSKVIYGPGGRGEMVIEEVFK